MSERNRALVETLEHHLRSPLTVIVGHAEMLVEEGPRLPAEVERSLATVLRAGRRLGDVVDGICDLVDAACADPATVGPVDVSTLLRGTLATCRERAARREIRLVSCGDTGVTCLADVTRLRRALDELLDNALTFAPDRSTVEVGATVAGTVARIEVSDDGKGIEPADRERLVRPFERGLDPSRPSTGPGMGLAVVSAIAAAHGGRLVLTHSRGGGLRACLELPVNVTHPGSAAGG
jgi:signal transduction histidine kinase